MSRLVLMGAGASYGSRDATPSVPPLAGDLLDVLQREFPETWGSIPARYIPDFKEDFELGMRKVWQDLDRQGAPLLRAMAEYFARFRPGVHSTYLRLIQAAESAGLLGDTVFSTLNYDCLFEVAAEMLGKGVDHFAFIASSRQRLTFWKLHGSCNYIADGISAHGAQFSNVGVEFGSGTRLVPTREVAPHVRNDSVPPVMAVMMRDKPIMTNPELLTRTQEVWRNEVTTKAHAIGVIGVKPNPDDAHLWEALAATAARIFVIGNEAKYAEWFARARPKRNDVVLGTRFTESFADLVAGLANP